MNSNTQQIAKTILSESVLKYIILYSIGIGI